MVRLPRVFMAFSKISGYLHGRSVNGQQRYVWESLRGLTSSLGQLNKNWRDLYEIKEFALAEVTG